MTLYDPDNPQHLLWLEQGRARAAKNPYAATRIGQPGYCGGCGWTPNADGTCRNRACPTNEEKIMDEIMQAAAAFNAADEDERQKWKDRDNAEMDVRIAERGGDEQAIAAAKEARDQVRWHDSYIARNDAAKMLLKAIGVDPAAMKRAL